MGAITKGSKMLKEEAITCHYLLHNNVFRHNLDN